MSKLVGIFFDIATLKLGPEDLPASRFLLGLVTAAYLATGALSVALYATGPGDAMRQLALDLGLLVVFFALVLGLYGKAHRLTQTMTALLGTGALLSAAALPLAAWLHWLDSAGRAGGTLPAAGIYLVVLWSIAVIGHIVHRALDLPYVGGLLIGLVYFILNLFVFATLFPAEA